MILDGALLGRLRVEPLDRRKHERSAFTCGVGRVDNFLRNTATRQQDQDVTRVYVACATESTAVVGFYALNAHAINAATLGEPLRRRLPNYDALPAIYLSMIAVHRDHQGEGIGSFLMADALKRCCAASALIGARFIVLDALNEDAARLYRRLGFVDLPGHEPRMLIGMEQVRRAIQQGE